MLRVENLTIERKGRELIKELSTSFSPGKLYGLVGPNGAGKTTLLKTLCGLWSPSKGKCSWEGKLLSKYSRSELSRTLSFVPQNPQVHFDFTVRDIVMMGKYAWNAYVRGKEHREHLEHVLETVDCLHLQERSILHLSQGERKRVYIARALITESPVLLLDEPTESLDIKHQLAVWELLKGLASPSRLILVSSHHLKNVGDYCDRVLLLKEGRSVFDGDVKDAFSGNYFEEVFEVSREFIGV